jgi:hypothetical protein
MRGMNKNSVVVVDDERLATQSEFLFQLERERESFIILVWLQNVASFNCQVMTSMI